MAVAGLVGNDVIGVEPVSNGMASLASLALPPVRMNAPGDRACRPRGATWKPVLLGSAPEPSRIARFLARRRLGVGTHDQAIDNQVLVVAVASEQGEDALPYAGTRPAGEALVHGLVLAIALGQVGPSRTRVQDPQGTVDKQPVINRRPPRIGHFPRQQRFNPMPLRLAQLGSLDPHDASATAETHESDISHLGNPECRYVLARRNRGSRIGVVTGSRGWRPRERRNFGCRDLRLDRFVCVPVPRHAFQPGNDARCPEEDETP